MVRQLNWGKCSSCGHEDYDINFEQTFHHTSEDYVYICTTKMVCPICEDEDSFDEREMDEYYVKRLLKEQRYISALFKYGVVPLLLLLDEYEQDNNFEECERIFNAISYCNKHLKSTEDYEELPTKYDSNTLSNLKKQFNLFGLTGDTSIANMPYYVEEIKKIVKL